MSTRIGVDIGGTFTDLVYYDDSTGIVVVTKVPTTSSGPEIGCMNAVKTGVPREVLESAGYFLHGTTVGLNALLERRGATVGMLTTAGFRDVLEIGRGSRREPYNVFWRPREPLVRRALRRPVRQRITYDGTVQRSLERQDVLDSLEVFRSAGVTAVAVVFLHSYANPDHELEVEQILRDSGFDGHISLSHRISGEYRDYERASTTVIDAFVRTRMSGYLDHISTALDGDGFTGNCLMTRSGGGSLTFSEAQKRPFETIMSGPVAGAEGAAELSRRVGISHLITADVGGTSFDAALVVDGRTRVLHEGEIDGMPVQSAWVDVRSIGAGGGSVAAVDVGGFLTVGPESTGADPGPACYGRGGDRPTVTDAAFFLGMLGRGALASGLALDRAAAEKALALVGQQLDRSPEQVAKGIIAIAGNHMASLIRELTIEQGHDPRGFTLLPFGGAGPMMGTQIARELDLDRILVPPHAGNFSAWGLLGSDLLRTRARTRVLPVTPEAVTEVRGIVRELVTLVQADDGAPAGTDDSVEVSLDMRFYGQEYTLAIAMRGDETAEQLAEKFRDVYRRTYGGVLAASVEIVNIRVSRRRVLPARVEKHQYEAFGTAVPAECFSFAEDRYRDFRQVHRGDLIPDERHAGPAIVYEPTTTTYVDSGFDYGVDVHGCLALERNGG
ncbi:MAG TPA: hydantoinase/oxoprolinase family protein [Jatrophihabitans sp.]|jgi:N-methylhydantoinase A